MLNYYLKLPKAERVVYLPERQLPLQAILGSAGHSRMKPTDGYDWHGLKRGRQEFVLFQFTLSGRGALRVDDAMTPVLPGQAMLLRIPADNRYWVPADSDHWDFIYVCLKGAEVFRLWKAVEQTHGYLTTLPPGSPAVRLAADIVRTLLTDGITTEFQSSSSAYQLIMALLDAGKPPEDAGPHATALAVAWRYGQTYFAEPIGVEALAEKAGLSRYYFTRLFTSRYGRSPMAWLVDLRVREAAQLLRRTTLPIKEVAVRCGFGDAGYFGKVFQARTGQPPGSYRRSGL